MFQSPEPSSDIPIRELPRWLLRHICRPENHRLVGKMPLRFQYASSGYSSWNSSHLPAHYHGSDSSFESNYDVTHYAGERHRRHRQIIESNRPQFSTVLQANDYRLWAEVHLPITGADLVQIRCRWCNRRWPVKDFSAVGFQDCHKRTCNFTHNLREVYNIVLQMKHCVVCNAHCQDQRWGVVMCRPCEPLWQRAYYNSERLGLAIIRARMEGRIKENEPGRYFGETISD